MSDLIKRLRSWQSPEDIEDAPYLVQGDLFEAADEIERLRAALDYNIEALSKADAMNAKLQAVVDAAKRSLGASFPSIVLEDRRLRQALAALENSDE